MKIYHNPRCSKSRQGLELLKNSNKPFEVVNYLEDGLSKTEITELLALLGIKPLDLVRRNEAIWKSEFRGQDLSDEAIINALVAHPKLIERPIVVHAGKAVIGRPSELIRGLL